VETSRQVCELDSDKAYDERRFLEAVLLAVERSLVLPPNA